mgnify:CR=1 FL=1|tara:strand:- start:334 stop:612 length:279 start_codon:yes stop_codon:yes gene_type:complete
METIILLCTILGAYIFGIMSGIIIMRKSTRSHEEWRDQMLQKTWLAKTRKNGTSRPISKKVVYDLNDDRLPAGFGTFGTGNSNGPSLETIAK